jgi:ribosomal protein S18 acetylase RimI-like enzyme
LNGLGVAARWTMGHVGYKTHPELTEPRIEFRIALPEDAPQIVALIESAYRGDDSRAGWTTEADLLGGQRTDQDEVSTIIDEPSADFILAYSEQGLLGCVLLRDERSAAYIGMLAIRPDCQASGLGRKLLTEAERRAQTLFSAIKARMTVIIQREELIQWYERRGYSRTDRREPFPYGDPRFGLPKRPDLEFIVLEKLLARG